MGGPTQPTRAARTFRVVLFLASAALCVSTFLPWCRVWGYTYTFFKVDDWRALPIAELAVAAGGVVAALIRLAWVKRIGVLVGASAFVINVVGAFVGARLANIHNPDPYFRIWAAISIWPEVGFGLAMLGCGILVIGGLSRWPVSVTLRETPVGAARPAYHDSAVSASVHGVPLQPARGDEF